PFHARGFPFFLRGAIDDFSFEEGDLSVYVDQVYLDALPYDFDRLIISSGGGAQIGLSDEFWTIKTADAKASIEPEKDRGWFVKAEAGASTIGRENTEISFARFLLNGAPNSEDVSRLEVSVHADDLVVADGEHDARIDAVRADFAIGAYEMLQGADAVQDWRSAGGGVDIHGLALVVGASKLQAKGRLRADQNGRPVGVLTATIEKPFDFIAALGAAGYLTADEAETARGAFALLSVAGGGVVEAPIEFEDGVIRLAGVTIALSK
ncbi:MAG: DUF2125 domain-containing protein, partial [Parvularculaceae bacterium]|nr:DUF2125 domain-containing protein [Parvularculaceae bacterium]